jgi:hypothetical protein
VNYQMAPRVPHPSAPSRTVREAALGGRRETKGGTFPPSVQKCIPQTAGLITPWPGEAR